MNFKFSLYESMNIKAIKVLIVYLKIMEITISFTTSENSKA